MKKYKIINFLSKEKKSNHIEIILILVSLLIIFISSNKIMNVQEEIQIDSNLESFEGISEYEQINEVSNIYIDFEPIKIAYRIIGKDNIIRISYEEKNLEVEGICKDLTLLEKLKNELKYTHFSINNISKNEGGYLFNLNCTVGV